MEAGRHRYQSAIEARNATGLMLIDRGDELSVLFERSHALEARIKAGSVGLQQQENEVRACLWFGWGGAAFGLVLLVWIPL